MTPLDELEKFYVELRGQAERQEIPVQQAMSTLQQKTVTDAAGVTWVVDPRRSTPTQAAFLSCSPGAQFLPAERSSFAQNFQAAQPGYQMAPMPGSMPPMPGAPAPMPGAPAPMPGYAPQPTAGPKPGKKVKQIKERAPRASIKDRLPSFGDGFSLSPRNITLLVVAFLLLAAVFAFFKMRGSEVAPPTSVITPGTEVTTLPPTDPSGTTAPVQTTPPTGETLPTVPVTPVPSVPSPDQATSIPGPDQATSTVPGAVAPPTTGGSLDGTRNPGG